MELIITSSIVSFIIAIINYYRAHYRMIKESNVDHLVAAANNLSKMSQTEINAKYSTTELIGIDRSFHPKQFEDDYIHRPREFRCIIFDSEFGWLKGPRIQSVELLPKGIKFRMKELPVLAGMKLKSIAMISSSGLRTNTHDFSTIHCCLGDVLKLTFDLVQEH